LKAIPRVQLFVILEGTGTLMMRAAHPIAPGEAWFLPANLADHPAEPDE